MSNKKQGLSKKWALGLALTFALAMLAVGTWEKLIPLAVLTALSLLYGLSGWVTKSGLSPAERMGRMAALLIAIGIAVGVFTWWLRPGWHLSGSQADALADIAQHIPHGISVLIEIPETSWQGQEYGRDIMEIFKQHGVSVNSITVFHGFDTPEGITVSARYRGELGYETAGYVHSKMVFFHMPARFQEGNTWAADANSFVIYIGSRPTDEE